MACRFTRQTNKNGGTTGYTLSEQRDFDRADGYNKRQRITSMPGGEKIKSEGSSIPFQSQNAACLFAYGYSNEHYYRVLSWTRKERIPPVKPGD